VIIQPGRKDADRVAASQEVDRRIREAIQTCWAILPKERQRIEEVETQIRRFVDRGLLNFSEDIKAFGTADN
jgi:hypothetical protein